MPGPVTALAFQESGVHLAGRLAKQHENDFLKFRVRFLQVRFHFAERDRGGFLQGVSVDAVLMAGKLTARTPRSSAISRHLR